jgi:ATP-dependent helicase HrpA
MRSHFLAFLNLWDYLREQQRTLSSSQFRKLCRAEFLHYLRIREWQDLESQLRQAAKSLGLALNSTPADRDRIHMSLLAGLLSHIGLKDAEKQDYVGARNARFAINPGSALFKKRPRWVMAAELVETTRLWARTVARIEPEWAETLGAHLVKRNHSEPHWERKRGAVVAYENVMLYGVPLVASRKVSYGRIDPELSRELFIRHALVEGDWDTHHAFFHESRKLLEEVEGLEHRVRRRDILVDDETLFAFYDHRIGPEVVSARHFDSWWTRVRREQPDLLTYSASLLVSEAAGEISERDYPDHWEQGELRLRLSYQFEPGADADGVTVHVPLKVLNRLSAQGFDWQIPGLRRELVTALIRSLPKAVRRNFVPAPDHAEAALERATPRAEPMLDALERELHRTTGVTVPRDAWDLDRVPDHLRITFRVEDESGRMFAEGKDLDGLQLRLKQQVQTRLSQAAGDIEKSGLRAWSFGTLPRTFVRQHDRDLVKGFPSLVDEGDSVAIRVLGSAAEQQQATWQGTRRLLLLNVPPPLKAIHGRLTNQTKLALNHKPHATMAALFEDCIACAVDKLIAEHGGPAWDQPGFTALYEKARAELNDTVFDVVKSVARILTAAHDVEQRVQATTSPALLPSLTDIKAQLTGPGVPGVRRKQRLASAARRPPLSPRNRAPAGQVAEQSATRPCTDPARGRGAAGVSRAARRAAVRPVGAGSGAGHPLDDRGAANQLLRAGARHRLPRL